ncbi:MAG: SDR family oxidoreductase [Planctomycetaceae bacterium]|nr:SDR family oxidoreductase [Planctomycetaceae bacterium]
MNATQQFAGRTAVVTGAARGMGAALARKYAENGADVVLLDLNGDGVAATAAEIATLGVKTFPIAVNIADYAAAEAAMKKVDAECGAVHFLANCAGISTAGKIIDVAEKDWDRVLDVNLKAAWTMSKLVAHNMIAHKVEKGKIVSISSQASKIGEDGNGVYSVSKAGMNMLTQVLGLELAPHGISVTAVCPGYVRTDMVVQVFKERGPLMGMTPEAYEKTLTDSVPMGRMATPEEIADLMIFLSSDAASYITGVTITSAGGKTLI